MAKGAKKTGGKTGGRQKGTRNLITTELKDMIMTALNDGPTGGVKWLIKQRDENETAFLSLIGKVLPLTVAGDKNNPIVFQGLVIERSKD